MSTTRVMPKPDVRRGFLEETGPRPRWRILPTRGVSRVTRPSTSPAFTLAMAPPPGDLPDDSHERRTVTLQGRRIRAGVLVAAAYYLGAQIGIALTIRPYPVSILWVPNAILLAALLLTPPRAWFF